MKPKVFWIAMDKIAGTRLFGLFDTEPFLSGKEWRGLHFEVDIPSDVIEIMGIKLKSGQKKKFKLIGIK